MAYGSTTKYLYEVEVTYKVYVLAESSDGAESMVADNTSMAWNQAKEHAQTDVTKISSLEDVDDDREFDRPLGSDKKIIKEILS